MGEVVSEHQMLVEDLERQLEWVLKNLAEGRGGQEMRDRKVRITDELKRLKEGD